MRRSQWKVFGIAVAVAVVGSAAGVAFLDRLWMFLLATLYGVAWTILLLLLAGGVFARRELRG